MVHWGTCPLVFQLFNFSAHFCRAARTLIGFHVVIICAVKIHWLIVLSPFVFLCVTLEFICAMKLWCADRSRPQKKKLRSRVRGRPRPSPQDTGVWLVSSDGPCRFFKSTIYRYLWLKISVIPMCVSLKLFSPSSFAPLLAPNSGDATGWDTSELRWQTFCILFLTILKKSWLGGEFAALPTPSPTPTRMSMFQRCFVLADVFEQQCCHIDCYKLPECKLAFSEECQIHSVECATGMSKLSSIECNKKPSCCWDSRSYCVGKFDPLQIKSKQHHVICLCVTWAAVMGRCSKDSLSIYILIQLL